MLILILFVGSFARAQEEDPKTPAEKEFRFLGKADRVNLAVVKKMSVKPVRPHTHYVTVAAKAGDDGKRYFWNQEGPFGLKEMKAVLHLNARTKLNPRTRHSEIRLVIGADARVPFRHVQELLALCAHADIQVWRVSFAVQRVEKDKKDEKAKHGRIRAHVPKEAIPADKIDIKLARRRDDTICYMNGRAAGLMSKHVKKFGEFLARYHDGPDTTVVIDPDPRITHQDVMTLLEVCRGRNIDNIAFARIDRK
jgi:biopolymer transport protein ExbD